MSTSAALCSILMGLAGPAAGAAPADDLVALARLDTMFAPGMAPAETEEVGLDAALSSEEPLPVAFGTEGSWRRSWAASGGFHLNDSRNTFVRAGIGFSYFIADHLSLEIEINGYYFDQKINDAFGVEANLLFRCHVYKQPSWTVYLEGGAGAFIATNEVPRKGSNFNFSPQGGGGISFDVGNDARAFIGARWLHLSNGSLYSDNPGRDYFMGYFSLSVPF